MTGRGRQRKAPKAPPQPAEGPSDQNKCTKSKTEEIKQVPLPQYRAVELSEEKRKAMPKKEVRDGTKEKANAAKEKSSVRSPPKQTTTTSSTETNKLQQTPGGSVTAPAQGRRTTSTAGEERTSQDSIKDSVRKNGEVTEAPVACAQQKDTKKTSIKSTKTQCSDKVRSSEDTPVIQAGARRRTTKDGAAVDSILYKTLEKLKIKRNDRANAAEAINEIKKKIITHLRSNSQCFKNVEEPLGTGSYYENVKISNPDEFDVMVPVPVERVNVEHFRDDGAFYRVSLKRGSSPLWKFQEVDTLSGFKMLEEFREDVKNCIKPFKEWTVTKKKKGCPAVTLTTEVQSETISLDVVLCLMVKSSWPCFTKEGLKINTWLGAKVKQDYKRKPYYLVPKYEGRGTVEKDGVLTRDVWRVSFSHIEKAILNNHGSEKTCCEKDGERCCRKDCLKLLKHLLGLLKEEDSSLDKFCSYHAKTTLLHACCSRTKDSEWKHSGLSQCFSLLLEDFISCLEKGELPNFFIPSQNLFSGVDRKTCDSLARRIKEERDECFPIFK